jgi:hypothetical protein
MIPPLKTPESQKITGDWVLFHPVYTPSELKAVDVSGELVESFVALPFF